MHMTVTCNAMLVYKPREYSSKTLPACTTKNKHFLTGIWKAGNGNEWKLKTETGHGNLKQKWKHHALVGAVFLLRTHE